MLVNKKFRVVVIAVMALFTSYLFIKRVDHTFAFDYFPLTGVSLIAIIVFYLTIFLDRKEYSKSKNKVEFLPTIIGITILFGLLTTLYILSQRDKSPSKLYCVTRVTDFNGVSIDFREDGTYKLTSWCLGADYYRGKYIMQDSIITLDEDVKILESNRLVIRPEITISQRYYPRKDTIYQKAVYQIAEDGGIIPNAIDFIVIDK